MKKEKPVLTYRFDHDTLFSAILAAHHEYDRMTGDFSLLVSGRFVRGDEEHNHPGAYKTTLRDGRVPFFCRNGCRLGFSRCAQGAEKWLGRPAFLVC
ncbi:MAG: hypothetical protein ACOX2W_09770 [Desulfomonilia bacterium]